MTLNRREFVQLAAAMGGSLAWGGSARASTTGWHERRDLYPEGIPMAVLFATGSSTRHHSGNRASALCCASKSLRAIPVFRSEMAD